MAAVLAMTAAACNSAADEAPGLQQGGTLRVAVNALPSRLDPQRISAALDANVSRLISRTLTTFKSEPGKASGELAPDLATDLGRPSENNTLWEFRLRDGIKWADGSAITCQHVKFGAERNYYSLSDGLPYARTYLKDNATPYKGPYVGTNEGLESVQCVDTKTIQYRLKQPVGDFNYSVSLPVFAPVKPGVEKPDAEYNLAPLASGPYKVKPGSRTETEMILVRNEFWARDTDKVRKAYPDQIILKVEKNVPALTNSIIENQGEARDTIMLNQDVAPNFVQQVMTDTTLQERTAVGPSNAVRYMTINTQKITHEKCRQALTFAFNKRKFRQAMGGSLLGELATTMIPPTLRAYQAFDHYGTKDSGGEGDIKRAEELIKQAKDEGKPCPDKITIAFADSPTTNNRYVKTVADAYVQIGIQVILRPIAPGEYFNLLKTYEIQSQIDMSYVGWIPDWANGSAVIPPLFKSTEVASEPLARGGSNYAYLKDAEIDKGIDEAMQESIIERQWKLWGELDSKISLKAASIPIIYSNAIRLHGSNVSGAFIHAGFGMPDLAALGLLNPGGSPS
jgi:peptide/nickel transport system substrate-binding protein